MQRTARSLGGLSATEQGRWSGAGARLRHEGRRTDGEIGRGGGDATTIARSLDPRAPRMEAFLHHIRTE